MTINDSTFNLTDLAERLFAEKRFMPLADKIRRARDLQSLVTDLEMALESLSALEAISKIPAAADDFERLATESALLNNAIVLYVRATKTTSAERGGFDLRPKFNDSQKAVHKELSDLRDQAIAHFGSGGTYSGVWQSEVVVLQRNGENAKPGIVTRRQTLDTKLAVRARTQIKVAHDILCSLRLVKLDEITEELNRIGSEDSEFYREIDRHPLNLDVFLSSSDAGKAARSSIDRGFAKGAVRHN